MIGLALAASLMVGVLHLSPFGVLGFSYFLVAAVPGVLLASSITRRVILPVWWKSPRAVRFGLLVVSGLATAILWLLMSSATPLDSAWRWGAGPQVGQSIVPRGQVSWGQAVPSVFEFNVSSWPGLPDPEWAWRMTTDLPGRLGSVPSRIEFRVTQPEGEIFNLSNGGQWVQYRGADGVTVVFKAERGDKTWQTVHRAALNLHTSPGQRRWHTVDVDLPASSRSLAIEVESGGNHLGDTVWVSVDRVSIRLMGLWLDAGRLLSLAHVISTVWLAFVVSVLAVAGLQRLRGLDGESHSRSPGVRLLGQSLLVWLLATMPIAVAAWMGASQLLLLTGWQRATWLSIKVNADDRSLPPPFIYVNHTGEAGDFEPVAWRAWKAGLSPVGIRPISNKRELRITAIEDERQQIIPPAAWRLPVSGMTLQDDKRTLLVTRPGVLWLPNHPYPGFLIFDAGPGAGKVELDWLDEQRAFDLSSPTPTSYRAALTRPAAYQGWLLLPEQEIGQIRVKLGNHDSAYVLHELTLYDDSHQTWTGSALAAGGISAAGCGFMREGDDLRVEQGKGTDCTLLVPHLRPLNVVTPYVRLFVCASLTVAGLAALALLAALTGFGRRWEDRYQIVESRPMAWLRRRGAAWTARRVALIVGISAVTFQLVYFLVVPLGYINDTHGYYGLARDFLKLRSLYAIDPSRTPGYPVFLASTIWAIGDQMEGVVLVQHLVLALLGPLTVWFLYPRVGPLVAALGGLFVGMGPTASLLANTVSTESLFASLSYLALICLIQYQSRPAAILLAGLAAGVATLIRPNGVVLPVVVVTWLFLRWWCSREGTAALRPLVSSSVAIALGCLLVVSPWLRAERGMTGRWELDNRASFTLWLNSVIQGRSPATLAINRPASTIFDLSPLASQCDDVEGWRLHSDLAMARHIDWPSISATDSRFFAESVREGIRQNPRRFLRFFADTFAYSLLHRLPPPTSPTCVVEKDKSEIHYAKFTYPLPVPKAVSDARDIRGLLQQLSYRWHPPQSRLRSTMLGVTQAGMDGWWIVAVLALAGLAACLMLSSFRDLTVLGLYWLASVTLLGVMGWPTDRYVFVLEPVVYVLATVMIYVLLNVRVRSPANERT